MPEIPTVAELEAYTPEQMRVLQSRIHDIFLRKFQRTYNCGNTFSAPRRLAAMEVGESILFPNWKSTSCTGGALRNWARRHMNNPQAQWASKLTTKGVRVTRIA